jgi:hypothetical protein
VTGGRRRDRPRPMGPAPFRGAESRLRSSGRAGRRRRGADGPWPPAEVATARASGRLGVVDGPFAETKEQLG